MFMIVYLKIRNNGINGNLVILHLNLVHSLKLVMVMLIVDSYQHYYIYDSRILT